ncbi:MAG: caspase family protein [Elusimicrobia bacterium]|nr:caspase family protein [Elusimicrobiota bacterium]
MKRPDNLPFALAALLLVPGLAAAGVWPDLSTPAPDQGGGEPDAAVVVGIEKYPFVAPVPGAAQNADDWHLYLTKTRKIPAGRVKLLRDSEATLEDMRDAASWAASTVKPGGTLWFVFIGHGAPHRDGKEGVLIGVDAQQRAESLYNRSLRQSELQDLLSKGQQAQAVVVLDACFSGRTSEGKELIKGLQPLLVAAQPSWGRAAVFTAGRSDQFAGPLPGAQRPAFSYLLLGALRGWADSDKDGSVTAPEALAFTQDALQTLLKDRRQTPELFGGLAAPLARPAHEPGPDLGAIARSVRPKDASELSFGEIAVVTLPSLKFAEIQGGFKEADINVERMLEAAMLAQKDPDALPLEKMQFWCGLWGTPEGNPYRDQAGASCKEWRAFTDKYQEAELNLIDDYWTLAKYLSLKLKTQEQKAAAINAFLTAYAALKDHPAFKEAAGARDLLASGGASSLPPMDDRGPLLRLKGQELPAELVEQAFAPCSGRPGSWCDDQERCKAGSGSNCKTFAEYGLSYSTDERSIRRTAFSMLGCLHGNTESCDQLCNHDLSTITNTKSLGLTMTVWTHACFFLSHFKSCERLGKTYGHAKGLSSGDLAVVSGQGVLALEAACLRGIPGACLQAGNSYRNKYSRTIHDDKRARLLFAKGCRQNEDGSCGALASLKAALPNLEADLAKAVAEEKRLAETRQRASELAEARPRLEAACSGSEPCGKAKAACEKDPKECYGYAYCFSNGYCGMSKEPAFAAAVFQKACEAGDGRSCSSLAWAHKAGEGISKDQARFLNLRDTACKLNYAPACSAIATDLGSGWNGMPHDPAEGFRFLKKACELGETVSCKDAAERLVKGEGVAKDEKEALAFARKACKGDEDTSTGHYACIIGMRLGDSWSRKQLRDRCKKHETLAQFFPAECAAAK